MNRRRSLAIIAAALLITGLLAMLLWHSEPRFGGRKLTEWALEAHDLEITGRQEQRAYQDATNAIHQMGPTAAKAAVDWLDDLERWGKSPFRQLFARLGRAGGDTFDQDKLMVIPLILRTVDDDARATVEERLIKKLSAGNRTHAVALTNFNPRTWPRIAPLLQHTNALVANLTAIIGQRWSQALKIDTDSLWRIRLGDTNSAKWVELEKLLAAQGADTNRLAELVGTNFINGGQFYDVSRRAELLSHLGPRGLHYLTAGLTNQNKSVKNAARTGIGRRSAPDQTP